MSCCITFIPREMAVLMRYSARPGIAQRTSASAETICGCTWRRLLKNRSATMTMAAVTIDCVTPSTTATRKSARLRARLPTASERAMNVVIALSSPRTPILLMMSVVDQATENIPSAAGPSIRATRNVKMPRKFDANIATVFKKAPRFSSTPVWSTRAGASVGGGGTSSVPSVVLTDLGRCHSPVNWLDANELTQLLSPASRESGHRLGRFLYYVSWERAPRFIFRRNMLDVTELKTTIHAHIVSTLQSSAQGRQIFFAKCFGHASVGCGSLYCVERRLSL